MFSNGTFPESHYNLFISILQKNKINTKIFMCGHVFIYLFLYMHYRTYLLDITLHAHGVNPMLCRVKVPIRRYCDYSGTYRNKGACTVGR